MLFNETDSTVFAEVDTPNILDCNEFRRFWVSWTPTTISVGSGWPFENMFLTYTNPSGLKDIQAVAVTSWEYYEGEWEVDQGQGELLSNIFCFYEEVIS